MGSNTAAASTILAGVGNTQRTSLQIVQDQSLEGKLAGKVIVITGASAGIGVETARALSTTGATLILTVRDVSKARTNLADILSSSLLTLVDMDLSSFESIHAAARTILSKSNNQVNILINNAGIMGIPDLTLTRDGYETHFATNHLGHFLLFQLLKPALLSSSSPDFHTRVVNVASSAHRSGTLNESGNYNFEKGGYHFGPAYAQSKLANIYMANEIERRYGEKGLHALSLHPGAIHTELSRNIGSEVVAQMLNNDKLLKMLVTPEQGAATTVVASVGKEWEGKGGKYLEACKEADRGEDDNDVFGVGYVIQTYDPQNEARLWRDSLEAVGIREDL